jgi:hypothetical protein
MQQSHGFDDGTERVCKLNRAIYNLWQAFRVVAWFRTLSEFPKIYRLRICQADDIVFFNEDVLRTDPDLCGWRIIEWEHPTGSRQPHCYRGGSSHPLAIHSAGILLR